MEKQRIITDYDRCDPKVRSLIAMQYPYGVDSFLQTVTIGTKMIRALFIESEDKSYLIRYSIPVSHIEDDDDDSGVNSDNEDDDDDLSEDSDYERSEEYYD